MLECPQCHKTLDKSQINTPDLTTCPSCKTALRADVFSALYKPLSDDQIGETIKTGKEASCFFHPNKKAEVTCAVCGRFLCSLCDLEINTDHLCPLCLEKGRTKRKISNLENNRTCYDTIALCLAVYPLLIFWPTLLTAPIAIFISIRYWKTPSSIIPRTKFRFIAAIGIAGLQIGGWVLFFANVFS